MSKCETCGVKDGGKGGDVEWRVTKDQYECAKCFHFGGSGGSRTPRRGGKGSGGLGRANY